MAHHLLEGAHDHGAAPDHGGVGVDEVADGHGFQAPGFDGKHGFAADFGLCVDAEHAGEAGAVDVGVEQADVVAGLGEGDGDVDGGGGFADAALAGGDGDDVLDVGEKFGAVGCGLTGGVGVRGRCGGGRAVGGKDDGCVGDAGLAGEKGLDGLADGFHSGRVVAVGLEGGVDEVAADFEGVEEAGADDVGAAAGESDAAEEVSEVVGGESHAWGACEFW